MIGSKRRVWAVLKLLHDEGVPIEKLARVHAPIGVDIAGQTPGEIAVSIAAELIKVRRGGKVPSLSDGLRERYMKLLAEGKELG
jgi:xanthine dehydrogenase accessory factor